MASGEFYGTTSNERITSRILWESTPNMDANTSTITVTLQYIRNNNYITDGTGTFTLTIGDTTYTNTQYISITNKGYVTAISKTVTGIKHNDDGTKSIKISCSGKISVSGSTLTSTTCSGTAKLDTIPRAAQIIDVGNIKLGSDNKAKCDIEWKPTSTTFKYKIQLKIKDKTDSKWSFTSNLLTVSSTSKQTYDGIVDGSDSSSGNSFYNELPTSTSTAVVVTLFTYKADGTTQIGSAATDEFNITIPDNLTPIAGTVKLEPNKYDLLIQNINTLKLTAEGFTNAQGSQIISYHFYGPNIDKTVSSNSAATDTVVFTSGDVEYIVTATDARGRTAVAINTITCIPYTQPSFSSFDAFRVSGKTDTSSNNDGEYIRCPYAVKYSTVNNTNSITVTLHYKRSGVTTQVGTNTTNSKNNNGAISDVCVLNSMSNKYTYMVYATIRDQYSNVDIISPSITVFSATRIINILHKQANDSPTNTSMGIGLGKMAEETDLLDVAWAIKSENRYVVTAADVLFPQNATSTGINGTVTLTNSLADYAYIDICYSLGTANNMYPYNSMRIYEPNGKQICLSLISSDLNTPAKTHIYRAHYSLFEKEVRMDNVNWAAHVVINGTATTTTTGTNGIKIFKVVGYKR